MLAELIRSVRRQVFHDAGADILRRGEIDLLSLPRSAAIPPAPSFQRKRYDPPLMVFLPGA